VGSWKAECGKRNAAIDKLRRGKVGKKGYAEKKISEKNRRQRTDDGGQKQL